MSTKDEPPIKGIETRFRDLSADVRQERLVRYFVHQIGRGRHVDDIFEDPYVLEHSGDVARSHITEHPEVLQAIEEQLRRQFAGYGGSISGPATGGGVEEHPAEQTTDAELPDM